MQSSRAILLALAAALTASCSGSGYGSSDIVGTTNGTPGAPSTSNAIAVRDNSFSPASTTVAPGTTVTWTWGGASSHNVTFDDGVASGTQRTGTFQRTFASPGAYPYHCTIHGVAMSGMVLVQ